MRTTELRAATRHAPRGPKRVIYAALAGNSAIAVIKFIAAAISGSSAMLSEAVHSVVDTGNQFLMLYGRKRAGLPPDENFPFGHGKEIYFWTFVVALLIFALGAGISLYEGVRHIISPRPLAHTGISYAVLAASAVFEGASWFVAFKEFRQRSGAHDYLAAVRRAKDPTVFAVLFEDTAALAGLMVAFLGILLGQLTGVPYFDGAASILISVILAAAAFGLARESKGLLIGESANREVVAGIRNLAEAHPEVEQVGALFTMHMGPDFILVNLNVAIDCEVSRARAHQVIDAIDRDIRAAYPMVRHLFIEPANHCADAHEPARQTAVRRPAKARAVHPTRAPG